MMTQNLTGQVCTVTHGTHQLMFFVHDSKDEIQKYHVSGSFYEAEELKTMAPYVRPFSSILEVGANIGNHTVFFDRILRARRLVVVEPNPESIKLLRINTLLNACTSVDHRMLGYGLGLRDARATVQPSMWDNNLGGAELRPDPHGAVPIVRGDDVFAHEEFDFIKVDVEGMEIEVLQGLEQTVRRTRPAMFVEIRDHARPDFDDFLRRVGYCVKASNVRYENVTNYIILPNI